MERHGGGSARGVAYGKIPDAAKAKVQGLVPRVMANRLGPGEADPALLAMSRAA